MKSPHVIPIRFSHEKWEYYTRLAELSDKPLGTYLRERLEREDNVALELSLLRQSLARDLAPVDNEAILLETLLLLRASSNPQKIAMVAKTMESLGLSAWEAEATQEEGVEC